MHISSAKLARASRPLIPCFAVVAIVCILPITPITAADESPSINKSAWVNIPGGIADAVGHCAYFANASDGLSALDLQDGHTLWDTKEAIQPLALDGFHLIALRPRPIES